MIQLNLLQFDMIWYNSTWFDTIQFVTIQHDTIWYDAEVFFYAKNKWCKSKNISGMLSYNSIQWNLTLDRSIQYITIWCHPMRYIVEFDCITWYDAPFCRQFIFIVKTQCENNICKNTNVWYNSIHYNTIQYNRIQLNLIWYIPIPYNKMRFD